MGRGQNWPATAHGVGSSSSVRSLVLVTRRLKMQNTRASPHSGATHGCSSVADKCLPVPSPRLLAHSTTGHREASLLLRASRRRSAQCDIPMTAHLNPLAEVLPGPTLASRLSTSCFPEVHVSGRVSMHPLPTFPAPGRRIECRSATISVPALLLHLTFTSRRFGFPLACSLISFIRPLPDRTTHSLTSLFDNCGNSSNA